MAFAQLTERESLRDIEARLEDVTAKHYHSGVNSEGRKFRLSEVNENCDWRINVEFALFLVHEARKLYKDDNSFIICVMK